VAEVRCPGEEVGWSAEEPVAHFGIVLVRRGLFRRRVDGVESVADVASGYLQIPGSVQQVAHPCGGDVCTFVGLGKPLLGTSFDAAHRLAAAQRPLFTSSTVDLAHRRLLVRAQQGADAFDLTERATELGGGLLDALAGDGARTVRIPSARTWRLVDDARQALAYEAHLPLGALARRAGVSAFYLSRYRTHLRVRRALDRIAGGERNLARLAADLGFSDQAHLTRCVRAELGVTPGVVRRLLHTR
jgi:AraC-like DNA-binding protein